MEAKLQQYNTRRSDKYPDTWICTCKSWIFQRADARDRHCKHTLYLMNKMGLGEPVVQAASAKRAERHVPGFRVNMCSLDPPAMTYKRLEDGQNDSVLGWLVSVKHDGMFGRWDGHVMLTRSGNTLAPVPSGAGLSLPTKASLRKAGLSSLDGEIFMPSLGPGQEREGVAGLAHGGGWPDGASFLAFDGVPVRASMPFSERIAAVSSVLGGRKKDAHNVYVAKNTPVPNAALLRDLQTEVTKQGLEGLVLRDPDGLFAKTRTRNTLKWKPIHRGKVRVVSQKASFGGRGTIYTVVELDGPQDNTTPFNIYYQGSSPLRPSKTGILPFSYSGRHANGHPELASLSRS